MDASFAAFERASQQLSADNQAVIDWADDTEFRLSVTRREPRRAIEQGNSAALQDAKRPKH